MTCGDAPGVASVRWATAIRHQPRRQQVELRSRACWDRSGAAGGVNIGYVGVKLG